MSEDSSFSHSESSGFLSVPQSPRIPTPRYGAPPPSLFDDANYFDEPQVIPAETASLMTDVVAMNARAAQITGINNAEVNRIISLITQIRKESSMYTPTLSQVMITELAKFLWYCCKQIITGLFAMNLLQLVFGLLGIVSSLVGLAAGLTNIGAAYLNAIATGSPATQAGLLTYLAYIIPSAIQAGEDISNLENPADTLKEGHNEAAKKSAQAFGIIQAGTWVYNAAKFSVYGGIGLAAVRTIGPVIGHRFLMINPAQPRL